MRPSPLRSELEAVGAVFSERSGHEVAVTYGDLAGEYAATHRGRAIADRSARALVGVRGRDAEKLLQSLVSNDVEGVEPGGSCLAFVLTPKGRPVADLRLWREAPDAFVLEAEPELQDELAATVRRYRLAARAEISDDRDRLALVSVLGPLEPSPGLLVADGLLGTDVLGAPDAVAALWRERVGSGYRPIGSEAFEIARVEAGVPRFGAEIDASVLPAETGLVERTVSFTKGCYVGQEPVARLHYRGHPNRQLRRLLSLEGALPAVPAEIALGDRVVGRLTSAVQPPGDGPAVGLGYVRREVEEGAIVEVRQPAGEPSQARVTALEGPAYPASMAARRP
jgi:tRNA-modifying protein YgfZ